MGYKKIENQDIHGKSGEQDVFDNVLFVNCNFKEIESILFDENRLKKIKKLFGSKVDLH